MARQIAADRIHRSLIGLVLLIALLFSQFANAVHAQVLAEKNVLVLNSYHQGYKWSDDVMIGIASVFGADGSNVRIQTEYMDTQRISDARYLQRLAEIYAIKFRGKPLDAIIASDDPAFNFLLKYRNQLFPGTPIVFCGVNFFDDSILKGHDKITGVIEAQDIASTLELALKLHPGTREIFVVNDDSTTGKAVAKDLNHVVPQFDGRLKFSYSSGMSIEQIQQSVSKLPADTLILYLILFEDATGQKFSYNEAILRLASSSNMPIYGVWDFTLGYGLAGGKLTSGFFQGEKAANLAQRILNGEEASSIPIIKQGSNRYMFDSAQLKRFNINSNQLPADSIVINDSNSGRKQVLVLNSYHYGMNWTDGIVSGIKSQFSGMGNVDLHFEFMDTKRNSEPEYLQRLPQLYRHKFGGRKFDMVITSDDDAYNLVRKYHAELFQNVPIVFCGVNYFQPDDLEHDKLITGVVEAIDIRKSLELALKLHPATSRIIVVNDLSSTGKANRKLLDPVISSFRSVKFQFFEDMNMSELEERVSNLPSDNLIFLLSFNRDKSNNVFSYEDSIKRIAAHAKVPIYGVWDFYLGNGIVGGLLTNGFSQGEMAAKIGIRVLGGERPDSIPVDLNSPNQYMFDYRLLKQFSIDPGKLPSQSITINQPDHLLEKYGERVAIGLALVLAVSAFLFYRRKKSIDQLKQMAETDPLIGILNRRAGTVYLKQLVKSANLLKTGFTIWFIDLDRLKEVNDTQGHQVGDCYLRESGQILQQRIRKGDLLCRYGGDEFVVAINNCNIEQSIALWNKIEEDIQAFNLSGASPFKISMSRGFAEYDPDDPVPLAELVNLADTEMYQFKQQRRAASRSHH